MTAYGELLEAGDRWRDEYGRTLTITEVGAISSYYHIDGEAEPRKIPTATLSRVLAHEGAKRLGRS